MPGQSIGLLQSEAPEFLDNLNTKVTKAVSSAHWLPLPPKTVIPNLGYAYPQGFTKQDI
jgi:hypothetical protein